MAQASRMTVDSHDRGCREGRRVNRTITVDHEQDTRYASVTSIAAWLKPWRWKRRW